jgi:hypothetical protein
MSKLIALLALAFALPVQSAKIQKLSCRAWDSTQVEIVFNRRVDPLVPFTSYEFGAQLEVFSKRGVYGRADVRITPLKTTHDFDLRGDAGGAIFLRLTPGLTQNEFSGKYTGQLFVNDLDAKAYFNFKDTGSLPGLLCDAQ